MSGQMDGILKENMLEKKLVVWREPTAVKNIKLETVDAGWLALNRP